MDQNDLIKAINVKTRSLLNNFIQIDLIFRKRILVESPISIHGNDAKIVSWFVGLTVEDKLLGFFQFDSKLDFMRYSSFQRKPDSIKECPDSKMWLNTKYVMKRAQKLVSIDYTLENPILSFDGNLARIAWLVKAVNKNGDIKKIFVAGDYVYVTN